MLGAYTTIKARMGSESRFLQPNAWPQVPAWPSQGMVQGEQFTLAVPHLQTGIMTVSPSKDCCESDGPWQTGKIVWWCTQSGGGWEDVSIPPRGS